VLSNPDVLLLLDVYSAGEKPIPGADGASLAKAIGQHGTNKPVFVEEHQRLAEILQGELRDGDVLLMQGAGNIGMLASHLAATNLCESVPFVTSARA
jgi:UDP-N-acetylmuramate--alanine ligase